MTFRFYSVPGWKLITSTDKSNKPRVEEADEATLEPTGADVSLIEEALARVEYRGFKAVERANDLLSNASKDVVYASSPNDLPALLRTADQLVTMAKAAAGERAQLWRCPKCNTRYAVPVALVRPVSLSCDRCDQTIELDPTTSEGESNIADPHTTNVNAARISLAEFFREAMARGWPVLVAKA